MCPFGRCQNFCQEQSSAVVTFFFSVNKHVYYPKACTGLYDFYQKHVFKNAIQKYVWIYVITIQRHAQIYIIAIQRHARVYMIAIQKHA